MSTSPGSRTKLPLPVILLLGAAGLTLVATARSVIPRSANQLKGPSVRPYPAYPETSAVWVRRFRECLALRSPSYDTVVLGDSITAGWGGHHTEGMPPCESQSSWLRLFGPRALNLGFGGDSTHNAMWRILHGGLDGLRPKRVFILLGTNNIGKEHEAASAVVAGIHIVEGAVRSRLPKAVVIVLPLIPRYDLPSYCAEVAVVDRLLNLPEHFDLAPVDYLPDRLHPNARGYRRIAAEIEGH